MRNERARRKSKQQNLLTLLPPRSSNPWKIACEAPLDKSFSHLNWYCMVKLLTSVSCVLTHIPVPPIRLMFRSSLATPVDSFHIEARSLRFPPLRFSTEGCSTTTPLLHSNMYSTAHIEPEKSGTPGRSDLLPQNRSAAAESIYNI